MSISIVTSIATMVVFAQATTEGQEELSKLGERYEALEKPYFDALNAAETPELRRDVYRRLAPANLLLDDFFALEKKHRGSRTGLFALYRMASDARSVIDHDLPISQAKAKGVALLLEHYLEHKDLDFFFVEFQGGALVPQLEVLLRRACDSPHRHVSAAAKYYLARLLHTKLTLPMWRQQLVLALAEPARNRRAIEGLQKHLNAAQGFGEIDNDRVRGEAVRLADQVVREYADVRLPLCRQNGPAGLRFTRLSEDDTHLVQEQPAYGKLADSLRFELEHLMVGQVAPDIEGRDPDGKRLKLSDYQGQVVVLLFCADWCGPCKAMYAHNRELLEEHRDRPFAILGVMGDRTAETVKEAIQKGDITWPVWWDGDMGPITTRWNVLRYPTVYVLDQEGLIRYRGLRDGLLERAVSELLDECKPNPDTPRDDGSASTSISPTYAPWPNPRNAPTRVQPLRTSRRARLGHVDPEAARGGAGRELAG